MSMASRVLFPQTGFTTDDLVDTYEQLAPVLLPHLSHRPLTLKRFPDDIPGETFWEKDAPSFTPPFVHRAGAEVILSTPPPTAAIYHWPTHLKVSLRSRRELA
jgi:DNA primase